MKLFIKVGEGMREAQKIEESRGACNNKAVTPSLDLEGGGEEELTGTKNKNILWR